jgi:hypothetical protein
MVPTHLTVYHNSDPRHPGEARETYRATIELTPEQQRALSRADTSLPMAAVLETREPVRERRATIELRVPSALLDLAVNQQRSTPLWVVTALEKHMRREGQPGQPAITDDGRVIDGYAIILVAHRLGWTHVACTVVHDYE